MAKSKKSSEDDDLLRAALDDFKVCQDAEDVNRTTALADIKFSRLGEQWDSDDVKKRKIEVHSSGGQRCQAEQAIDQGPRG